MRHVVIVGGGAALAQPLIRRFLITGCKVTAMCRRTDPRVGGCDVVALTGGVKDNVDVLVTLTGSTADVKIKDMNKFQWQDVIDSCLTAPAQAMTEMFLKMKPGGNVVVVGSVVGSTGAYGAANYAAAKAGLVGLVRSAALEWASRDIKVNLLELGFIDAGMGARLDPKVKERVLPTIPLRRFGTEEDFVHAVEFLATTKYATGTVLTLAGGLR